MSDPRDTYADRLEALDEQQQADFAEFVAELVEDALAKIAYADVLDALPVSLDDDNDATMVFDFVTSDEFADHLLGDE